MPVLAKSVLSFLGSHWKGVLIALAFAALGLKLLAAQGDARHWHKEADRFSALYKSEQLAHAATIANYRRAAELARAQDQANKARVERDQAKISQEVSHDYQVRLAELRARYDALRVRGKGSSSAGNPGSGGIASMPEASDPALGSDGAGALDPFACEANTLQLTAIQQWVRQQSAVDISDGPQPQAAAPQSDAHE